MRIKSTIGSESPFPEFQVFNFFDVAQRLRCCTRHASWLIPERRLRSLPGMRKLLIALHPGVLPDLDIVTCRDSGVAPCTPVSRVSRSYKKSWVSPAKCGVRTLDLLDRGSPKNTPTAKEVAE